MKIENLKIGQTIKNYKELCSVLDIKEKISTNSKKSQLKELERYVLFHKEGQKFIIDEIYEEVKEKMDNRSGGNNSVLYIEHIKKLILDLLVQSIHKESVCLSKNRILKELKMINDNYAFCKFRIPKLSKFTGIQQETIDEWYASTDTTLKNNLERALDDLKKQSLIIWSNEISVCKVEAQVFNNIFDIQKEISLDEYDEETVNFTTKVYLSSDFREATDEEKKFIIYTEREMLKKMNLENKAEVVKRGLWDYFKNAVNEIILKELNIDFYYNSYKILFNQDHILEKYEEFIDNKLLTKEEREETQSILNKAISERINYNSFKRKERAEKEFYEVGLTTEKLERRIDEKYIEDNSNLVKTLISSGAFNIKNKIKKVKLEKTTN